MGRLKHVWPVTIECLRRAMSPAVRGVSAWVREIDALNREGREGESVAAMQEWFVEPQQRPSVRDEE